MPPGLMLGGTVALHGSAPLSSESMSATQGNVDKKRPPDPADEECRKKRNKRYHKTDKDEKTKRLKDAEEDRKALQQQRMVIEFAASSARSQAASTTDVTQLRSILDSLVTIILESSSQPPGVSLAPGDEPPPKPLVPEIDPSRRSPEPLVFGNFPFLKSLAPGINPTLGAPLPPSVQNNSASSRDPRETLKLRKERPTKAAAATEAGPSISSGVMPEYGNETHQRAHGYDQASQGPARDTDNSALNAAPGEPVSAQEVICKNCGKPCTPVVDKDKLSCDGCFFAAVDDRSW